MRKPIPLLLMVYDIINQFHYFEWLACNLTVRILRIIDHVNVHRAHRLERWFSEEAFWLRIDKTPSNVGSWVLVTRRRQIIIHRPTEPKQLSITVHQERREKRITGHIRGDIVPVVHAHCPGTFSFRPSSRSKVSFFHGDHEGHCLWIRSILNPQTIPSSLSVEIGTGSSSANGFRINKVGRQYLHIVIFDKRMVGTNRSWIVIDFAEIDCGLNSGDVSVFVEN